MKEDKNNYCRNCKRKLEESEKLLCAKCYLKEYKRLCKSPIRYDKQGYVIIIVILLITAAIGYQIYKSIIEEEKSYEFAKNGEIFKSNNCYVKDDICYCEYENKVMQVDSYYER